MFESLTEKFNSVFRSLSGRGRITEANISDAMRDVRKALLEADVSYNVVKQFCKDVTQAAVGAEVIKSLHPGQVMIKIVNDQLTKLMGPVDTRIYFVSPGPTIIMLAGLQGGGKTTTAGKLAQYLLSKNKKPLLVADDLQRPAAIDQLCTLGQQLGVETYAERDTKDAVRVARNGVQHAKTKGCDVVILDTAGRLHIDVEMMEQIKAVTGKPIKFIGVGEKLDKLEEFHPDRMASRILGMGDVVSLVEKAQEQFDAKETQKMQAKMAKGTFGFDDFLKQMQAVRKMGGMSSLLKLMPGMGGLGQMDIDDGEINKIEGIVHSMTKQERKDPDIIDSSRRRRIARGCGRDVQEVASLIKTFKRSRDMMKALSGGGLGAMRSLMSGKMDIFSAMSSGAKFKSPQPRHRSPRKRH